MSSHGGWGTKRFKRVNTCHPDRRHYANGLCRSCYRNTPQFKAQRRKYYQANKEQYARQGRLQRERRVREAKRYGISPEEQEAMLEAQGHVCAICKRPPGKKRLGIDHDHDTGKVRGMLCAACNRALGMFQDDPRLCERAAQYLHRHSLSTKTPAA